MSCCRSEHEWLRIELGDAADGQTLPARGNGCSHCNGTGYQGRTGVYEMLEMTRPVVEAANQPETGALRARPRARRWPATRCAGHAAQLVVAGRTTVEEAMRVSSPDWTTDGLTSPTRAATAAASWCRACSRAPTAARSRPSCSAPASRRSRSARPQRRAGG